MNGMSVGQLVTKLATVIDRDRDVVVDARGSDGLDAARQIAEVRESGEDLVVIKLVNEKKKQAQAKAERESSDPYHSQAGTR